MAGFTPSAEQAAESLKKLTLDPQKKPVEAPDTKKQPSATQAGDAEQIVDTPCKIPAVDEASSPGPQDLMEANMLQVQNSCAPQTYYYGGYESPAGEWEEYPRYVNIDGMKISSPGVYNENGSILYHPGYAYASPMLYGPYSPAGAPLTTIRADGQFYSPKHFHHPGPFYQQPVSPGVHYISTSTPMSPADLSTLVGVDQSSIYEDGSSANFFNGHGVTMPARPSYPVAYSSFGRGGAVPVTITSPGYQDLRHGFDGNRPSNSWTESSRASEGQQRLTSTAVPSVISYPTPAHGPFGKNIHAHLTPHIQGAQQPRTRSGIGPVPSTFNRVYSPSSIYPQVNNFGRSSPGFGGNGRTLIAVDKIKPRGGGNGSICNCIGTLNVISEQNRGPRTARLRNQSVLSGAIHQVKEQSLTSKGSNETRIIAADRELYNRSDFVTKYKDVKFFIIKSYSEDNIHKSIKYGVWASTPNGNKKLDAAYKEAQEKLGGCPVFLFFSVNASGQFCGVAAMEGSVDFQTSVDYWQKDKWSGQFPVKWYIIKDVPNSQFRHITLENNDNKPVTNSRDTQEVKSEQGTEMLNTYKNYVCKTSILDDFQFYEACQKAMQEKRARQEVNYQAGVELGQDKSVKVREGKTAEDRRTPTEVIPVSPSMSDGLSGEGRLSKPRERLFLKSVETYSIGDALKPTTEKCNGTQVAAGDTKSEPND